MTKNNNIKGIFSSKDLDLNIYKKIISIIDNDAKIDRNIKIEMIIKLVEKHGFDIVIDCFIEILLDKKNKRNWDIIIDCFWEEIILFGFLKNHSKKDIIVAVLWYCVESYPNMNDYIVHSISSELKKIPLEQYCMLGEFYAKYPDEEYYYSRNHPDVIKELNNLRKIYD